MPNSIFVSYPEPGVAQITIDVQSRSANMLSQNVLAEIDQALDVILQREGIIGIVFVSAKSTFIVGADIREIAGLIDQSESDRRAFCKQGQDTFQRLANCKPVTVAAIHGACVGGGAELASWCDERVMSDDPRSQIGYPEVHLGLIPCWGGTVRTPRLIGLKKTMQMITSGESVRADQAKEIGFVREVCSAKSLLESAIEVVRFSSGQVDSKRAGFAKPLNVSPDELAVLQEEFSEELHEAGSGQLAPKIAMQLLLDSASLSFSDALEKETEAVLPIFGGEENRALLNVFFLNDLAKKTPVFSDTSIKPQSVHDVAMVGAGVMGEGVGAVNLKKQIPFLLFDIDQENIKNCADSICADASLNTDLLKTTTTLSDLENHDIVLEAIIENKDIKAQFYEKLEPEISSQTIIASNTSTIPITKLAENLQHPERFIGMHFFYPVRTMPLVELIRGQQTSDQTVATAAAYVKQIGKRSIIVNDGPGFLVNRLLFPYSNEAVKLLDEGATVEQIDAATVKFGMRAGPFTMFDLIGLDTAAYSAKTLYMEFYRRVAKAPVLPALVKAKRLGVKTGQGFYSYQNDSGTKQVDPTLNAIIAKYLPKEPKVFTDDEIIARLFLPTLVEATLILQEGLVQKPSDVDLGIIHGLGFPKSRGGLLFWADQIGPQTILEQLKPFEELGPRFQPTELMQELAKTSGRYYNLF